MTASGDYGLNLPASGSARDVLGSTHMMREASAMVPTLSLPRRETFTACGKSEFPWDRWVALLFFLLARRGPPGKPHADAAVLVNCDEDNASSLKGRLNAHKRVNCTTYCAPFCFEAFYSHLSDTRSFGQL
jgi:hypothetical protein